MPLIAQRPSPVPPQHAVLSMGTSDTVLTSSDAYVPDVNTHTFVHPGLCAPPNAGELEAGLRREGDGHDAAVRYMTMLCYKSAWQAMLLCGWR